MILEEFDPAEGIITPFDSDMTLTVDRLPEILIAPFSGEVMAEIIASENCIWVGEQHSINQSYPVYLYKDGDRDYTIARAELGATNCIGALEELMANGVKKVILFGSCGVLDKSIPAHQVIVPTSAIRDEGTSYHYAPSADEIEINPQSIKKLIRVFDQANVDYMTAKTWTTDGFFRETPNKTKHRLEMGCQVVDMECSAVAAWAQYRHTETYHFFYTADHVDIEDKKWRPRRLERTAAHPVYSFFELALYLAKNL
ncbi:nucleoside phosphorylase [Sporolactobacillus shoreae]|nr:nucleoside phosphorylase [Sporolactobacillus shoreae]